MQVRGGYRNDQYTRRQQKVPPPFAHSAPPGLQPPLPARAKDSKKKKKRRKVKKRVKTTQAAQRPGYRPIPKPQYHAHDTPRQYDVAVYNGTRVSDLKRYLTKGNVDFSRWSEKTLKELQDQIRGGKCELGLDSQGNAFRVANVSKVFLFDRVNGWLLYNPVNSLEDREFVSATKTSNHQKCANLQSALTRSRQAHEGELYYDGIADELMFGKSRKPSKNVEIPSSFIFQTTFSPVRENPREAAARVLSWRFGLKNVTGRIFSSDVPMTRTKSESSHFPGLKSEYHVHHVKLSQEYIIPLQKVIEVGGMTAMTLDEVTNTGINTHWYCWIRADDPADEMIKSLRELYKFNPKVKNLVGDADFQGEMAQAVGMFMKEEADHLDVWEYE